MANPFTDTFHPSQSGLVKDIIPRVNNTVLDAPSGHVAIGAYVTTGGTLDIVTAAGNTRQVTMANNSYLVCGITQVKASSTATGVHILVI